ncbi:cystinosin domain protein [Oesophagostomum dentatum]|uniref:Cystinosin domain protein n=1 Tax=Oesophagostomum dentatum TaxID=61180 RepID=A0A0B1TDJ1_OESDE|nr:cystinosin domain protein [Oesophagostomum dentatum]
MHRHRCARGNQRVSYTCMAITATMGTGALATGIAMVLGYMNMLQFVTSLSYIKMAVTLFKYIPQALLNFRRKSTTGWSIGNVLLDFTGGCLDILQMCLQCWNVADWTAFYGNPVKFGLGLVSIFFDILFMIQHYVLYPHGNERDDVEQDGESKRNFSKEGKTSGKEPVNEKLMSVHSERLQEKNGEERRATSRSDEEESGSKHDDGN